MVTGLLTLGVAMVTCYLCAQKRPVKSSAPQPACLEAFKEVMVRLQAGDKAEALACAVQIRCEHIRVQALKLVERSRPFSTAAAGEEWAQPVRPDDATFWDRLTVSLPKASAN